MPLPCSWSPPLPRCCPPCCPRGDGGPLCAPPAYLGGRPWLQPASPPLAPCPGLRRGAGGAWVRSACAPALPLFPLEETLLEEITGAWLVVTPRAVWSGCCAELLLAAEDCFGWGGDGRGSPQLPLAALGLCGAPPAGPAHPSARMGLVPAANPYRHHPGCTAVGRAGGWKM